VIWTVPLGLYVDSVKAQSVLANDSIQSLIAAAAEVFGRSRSTSVAHRREQAKDARSRAGWT
jgi:hypothetical protein